MLSKRSIQTLREIVNDSTNETLTRTIHTSVSTLGAMLMYLLDEKAGPLAAIGLSGAPAYIVAIALVILGTTVSTFGIAGAVTKFCGKGGDHHG